MSVALSASAFGKAAAPTSGPDGYAQQFESKARNKVIAEGPNNHLREVNRWTSVGIQQLDAGTNFC